MRSVNVATPWCCAASISNCLRASFSSGVGRGSTCAGSTRSERSYRRAKSDARRVAVNWPFQNRCSSATLPSSQSHHWPFFPRCRAHSRSGHRSVRRNVVDTRATLLRFSSAPFDGAPSLTIEMVRPSAHDGREPPNNSAAVAFVIVAVRPRREQRRSDCAQDVDGSI